MVCLPQSGRRHSRPRIDLTSFREELPQHILIRSILGVDPGTDLLEEGDLVVEINRRPTPDVASYQEVLESLRPEESAWLYVYRPEPSGSFLTRVLVEASR